MKINKPKFIIIPEDVMNDNKLSDAEKILYGRISGLSCKDGKCFASNKYLAEVCGVSVSSIKTRINNLKKHGYIKTEIKGIERIITVFGAEE